jgi:hypothetical protein
MDLIFTNISNTCSLPTSVKMWGLRPVAPYKSIERSVSKLKLDGMYLLKIMV